VARLVALSPPRDRVTIKVKKKVGFQFVRNVKLLSFVTAVIIS